MTPPDAPDAATSQAPSPAAAQTIASQAREVFDVTGAGDTVIAALCIGLLARLSLLQAAQVANVAAGVVVGKLGTATLGRSELVAALESLSGTGHSKILSLAQAVAQRQRWHQAGQTLVLTNGCFDLLHASHVHMLQAARAHGDRLLVALNSDLGVRALKGPQRPLVPEAERAFILGALACVDAVVLFDAPTPFDLIARLQPDILVKGGDYAGRPVVGRDLVEARGGRVALMPQAFGRTTTGLVQSIVERFGRGDGDHPAPAA